MNDEKHTDEQGFLKCYSCKTYYPKNNIFFSKNIRSKSGLDSRCKPCNVIAVSIFKRNNRTSISFNSAQQRCENKSHKSYKNYGARGIKCKFNSYRDIIKDIGARPKNCSLERIDNNGHYESGNIRWATLEQQARNKRNNVFTVELVKKAKILYLSGYRLYQISKKLNINSSTISDVLLNKTWREVSI